jgi:dephospho-CoA kinase
MLLVGITGGIASGKTEVAKFFEKKGAIILSGDKIGKEIVEKNQIVLKKLVKSFGKEILRKDGSLHRRKLGEIAFSRIENTKKLNKIVHPFLLKSLKEKIKLLKKEKFRGIVVIDAALIVEWGLEKELDFLIFVASKREDKIKRLQKFKGYSRKEAIDRIKSQIPDRKKRKFAGYIIMNDKGLKELRKKTKIMWDKNFLGYLQKK